MIIRAAAAFVTPSDTGRRNDDARRPSEALRGPLAIKSRSLFVGPELVAPEDNEDQAGPHGWPGFNPKRFREAMREAAGVTKLRITEPQDKRWPLVVSGIPITDAMGVYNRRAKGCLIPAVVVAIFLLCLAWVHFVR